MLAAVLMLCSCSSDKGETDDTQLLVPVTVRTNDFSVSQDDFNTTRATPVAGYTNVKALTLAFYDGDGNEVYKTTQLRDDATTYTTFGTFSLALPLGSYTMIVLGNAGDQQVTLTGPASATWGDNKANDTFGASQAVNITTYDAVNLSATLNRMVTMVAVNSTDICPATVANIRMRTSTGGKTFNPVTGFATVNTGVVSSVSSANYVGSISRTGMYLFITADEQTTDVTIETLDANDQVLFSKTVTAVTLKRNRRTVFTGAMYTASSAATFTIESDWLSDYPMDF